MEENSSIYGSKLRFSFKNLRLAWQSSLSCHGDAGRKGKAGKKETEVFPCSKKVLFIRLTLSLEVSEEK